MFAFPLQSQMFYNDSVSLECGMCSMCKYDGPWLCVLLAVVCSSTKFSFLENHNMPQMVLSL